MQQRLLDGYFAVAVEKDAFTAKSAELKVEMERLRERQANARGSGEEVGRYVVVLFDFAQDAAGTWTVSGTDARRAILTRVLLKRSLSAVSLLTTKRKPFDVLAEGPFLDESRGGWPGIETVVGCFLAAAATDTAS